ncbi:DUF3160 domain-containing protein [Paraliomyxa miuraensis]|uniref:DUF3160 domain-containing protein n=1 Tax=Paraliomyxa miuraensis TaxID=376150 RepID=UPI0022568D08|nr:DUF3160 domain-containing protein [Paraliomyxa miuraensis]MCX4247979.1 DUF3160 domain-containing protein [Paraliomyxa miuraensis]
MLSASLSLACGSDGPAPTLGPDPELDPAPTPDEDPHPELPLPEPDPFLEQYAEVQAEAAQMSVDAFLARYPAPEMVASLSYDPLSSVFLDEITAFAGIDPAQQAVLADQGFVALSHAPVDTFESGYHDLYYADLPVLVTSDSILYALHRSFDAILMDLELVALEPELRLLLAETHVALGEAMSTSALPPGLDTAANDLDVYLTVARQLLSETPIEPVGDVGNLDRVQAILDGVAAEGIGHLQLFGASYDYDFSQMKPRGHYEDDPVLQRYFRAMIWLGRTDLAMVLYPPGEPVQFNRTALEGAVLLQTLMEDSGALARWDRIDFVLGRIIGERDSMSPADVPQFLADAGIADLSQLAATADEKLRDALIVGRYGIQRIMSQIMYTNPMDPPLRLPRVYQLLGQRFTIDSYVFHNVTYDRVLDLRSGSKVTRMLPDELDAQFVLGSNAAAQHLAPQLQQYPYQGVLHELRFLVDSHPADFWEANFYNAWLSGIRALTNADERPQYPEAMRTAAWQDKALNTRAAARGELRHDTLLYVKQSYSGGIGCEYPDAYVEPVPAFYARMERIGVLGRTMMEELDAIGYGLPSATQYFEGWETTMQTLRRIAVKELDQELLSGEEIAFLGGTIEQEIVGCGEVVYDGWYPGLFYDPDTVAEFAPTIADVHTAPTDEAGNERGWVQHMATGHPVLMVLTVPQCDGPRAYVGPISSYYDVLTEGYDRWSDSDWRAALDGGSEPARPGWTGSFLP